MLNAKGFNLLFLLLFLIDAVDCLNKQPVLYLLNICQIIVRHANVVSDLLFFVFFILYFLYI